MTVAELIERLQDCDPDAEVRIMSQESWPFENSISGIAVRQDFAGEDCECDHRIDEPHDDGCPAAEEEEFEDGLQAPRTCSTWRASRCVVGAIAPGRLRARASKATPQITPSAAPSKRARRVMRRGGARASIHSIPIPRNPDLFEVNSRLANRESQPR